MNYNLYVITDVLIAGGLPHEEIARRAVAGGADVIQLRDKSVGSRDLIRIGKAITAITRPAGALFIVNDRLDVGIACGADGVHLGQGDLRVDVARQLSPAGFIIGISVSTVEEARKAAQEGADYVALSPTFSTGSKGDAGPGHGLIRLQEISNAVSIPVIAIGGIGLGNVREVIEAGADGVAVISAVLSAPDISLAARELRSLIVRVKGEMGR
jgi:thiamine-phosphate pyrophosphorylase